MTAVTHRWGYLATRRWRSELTALAVSSDPGLLRLRLGLRATFAVGVASLILHWVGPLVGLPDVVAMLFGGMLGLNGAFAASGRDRRDAIRTLAGVPVAAALSVAVASALVPHRLATLIGFVAVMVAAAYVRRFGPRWFNYGMIAWLAYFFTTFVGFPIAKVPALLVVLVVAAGCVMLAALLLPDRPQATLAASLRAFNLRLDSVLRLVDESLVQPEPPDEQAKAKVHGATFRMLEAALLVDGNLAAGGAGVEAAFVTRHNVLDAELAVEELARSAMVLAAVLPAGAPLREQVRRLLATLRSGEKVTARANARSLARDLADRADELPAPVAEAVREIAAAVPPLLDGLEHVQVDVPAHVRDFRPAAELFLGNLPGAAASAAAALRRRPESRWGRLSQNTRLCIQVAVATSITIAAGDALSPRRYYWGVLACFLALTGTFTTGEIAVKGSSRVLGTIAGLLAATVAVDVSGRDPVAIVVVMLCCVFLGLYFFRVSYAVMAFAVTTLMGELYNVLHEFTADLLLLRLAETAIGAAVGIAVGFTVLPLRTGDVLDAARANLLDAVARLLDEVRRRAAGDPPSGDLFLLARRVDAALHQLALVARPVGGATLLGLRSRRAMQQLGRYSHLAYTARATAAAVVDGSPCAPALIERLDAELADCGTAAPDVPQMAPSQRP